MPQSYKVKANDVFAEQIRRELARRKASTLSFPEKYWSRFDLFITDCIEWPDGDGPTDYQLDMARDLCQHGRLCGRGPHGLGKTSFAAWCILWFALTRDMAGSDWKIPTTAGGARQLIKFLWPEVHKWARRLKWDVIGREPFNSIFELQGQNLKLSNGAAFAVATKSPELIEGAHADQLLYIFDEAKAISDEIFDAAEGAFSNQGATDKTQAFAVALSTPGEPFGRFYDIQTHKPGFEDWKARYVTFAEVLAAGRSTQKWADQRKAQWGEESALYKNRVLGEFASQDEQGVIPLAWVEAANERWLALEDSGKLAELLTGESRLDAVGCDVGDQGDETVIALRFGDVIAEIRRYSKQDTMGTVARLNGVCSSKGGKAIVDVIGIGAGVVSRLRELQQVSYSFDVVAFNAAEGTSGKDRAGELGFINKRAEAWWQMKERLDPAYNSTVALPPDDKLTGDLVAPRYKVVSSKGGAYQIEAKDAIRERIGRSTDTGDAVVMAFYQEPGQSIVDWYLNH